MSDYEIELDNQGHVLWVWDNKERRYLFVEGWVTDDEETGEVFCSSCKREN